MAENMSARTAVPKACRGMAWTRHLFLVALEAGVRGQGASVPGLWASSGPADSCLLAVSPGGEVDGEPSFSLLIPTLIPS